jgi:secreted trypsin-like serine protease
VRKSLKGAGRLKVLGLTLGALVAAGALAASALAVVNGSPDNGKHPYVGVALSFDTGALCSGSLISPTVFVTAAHCFPDGAVVLVDVQDSLAQDQLRTAIPGMVHVDPHYGPVGNGLAGSDRNDVAVVTLFGPVTVERYAMLPSAGYDDSLPNNQKVDIVGYGVTDPGSHVAGTRMIAPAKIIPGGGKTASEFLKLSSSPGHGGATCSGDSGGPDLQSGTDLMLAISSYGPSASCTAVEYSQRMDTPEALAFVNSFLQ